MAVTPSSQLPFSCQLRSPNPFVSSRWSSSSANPLPETNRRREPLNGRAAVQCVGNPDRTLKTCKNCKQQFDLSLNHPRACRFHTAHFGGETKRKFESVYSGGTMDTPDSGKVFQYWHCCGSEDPFDPGCTGAPHCSYDD